MAMASASIRSLRSILLWLLAAGSSVVWLQGEWPRRVVERLDTCPKLACDFVAIYLPQARILFAQPVEIVSGWFYPPVLGLMLQPIARLADSTAVAAWTTLNLLLTAVLLVLTRSALRPLGRWSSWAGAWGLVSVSLPVVHCIKWGQVSLWISVGGILALTRWTRLSSAIIGILGAVKLYPLAFLMWPALRRDFRTLRNAFLWTVGIGIVLPFALLGWTTTLEHFRGILSFRMNMAPHLGGQGLWPACLRWFVLGKHIGVPTEEALVVRVIQPTQDADSLVGVLAYGLLLSPTLAVLVASAVWLWRRAQPYRSNRIAKSGDSRAETAMTLLAVTLAAGPGWHHYFCFLPFALAVVLRENLGSRAGVRTPSKPDMSRVAVAIVAWVVLALPLWLLSKDPTFYYRWSSWGGTTVAALGVWGALLSSPARSSVQHESP